MHRSPSKVLITVLVVLVGLLRIEASHADEFDFVLNGLWNYCEGIQTGNCIVDGRSLEEDRVEFLFDYAVNCICFTRYSPDRTLKYTRNPTNQFVYTSNNSHVLATDQMTIAEATPWDVRLTGLTSHINLLERKTSLEEFRRAVEETWQKKDLRRKGKLATLTFEQATRPTGVVNRSITLDSGKNYAPVAVAIDHPTMGPILQIETEFQLSGDYWLPKRTIVVENGETTGSLELSWNDVNKPIRKNVFTVEAMELPYRTRLVSQAKNGKLTEDGTVETTGEILPQDSSSGKRRPLIPGILLVATLVSVACYYRLRVSE